MRNERNGVAADEPSSSYSFLRGMIPMLFLLLFLLPFRSAKLGVHTP
jgi:hypothetical protein